MSPDKPFSLALVAVTAPGYIGLIVTAFMAPFRLRGQPLRFAPLATLGAWLVVSLAPLFAPGLLLLAVPVLLWAAVEAFLFFRVRTRFGNLVGVCCLLFALGIANSVGPYLFVRFVHPGGWHW